MKLWGQVAIVVLAVGITGAAALHHGQLTNRWGQSEDVETAQRVIQSLPADFGPWHLQTPEKLPEEAAKILQCAGYTKGIYVHRETGETVMVDVLLGPPGPMSVHRPEICYSAVSLPQVSERERVTIRADNSDHSVWMVHFQDTDRLAGGLRRVYYAWSDGGPWTAADEPRITFGTRPYLYKIQIDVLLSDTATPETNDAGRAFLSEFIPVFQNLAVQTKEGGQQ